MGDKEHVNEVENEFNKFNRLCIYLYGVYCLPMKQTNMKYDIKLKC